MPDRTPACPAPIGRYELVVTSRPADAVAAESLIGRPYGTSLDGGNGVDPGA